MISSLLMLSLTAFVGCACVSTMVDNQPSINYSAMLDGDDFISDDSTINLYTPIGYKDCNIALTIQPYNSSDSLHYFVWDDVSSNYDHNIISLSNSQFDASDVKGFMAYNNAVFGYVFKTFNYGGYNYNVITPYWKLNNFNGRKNSVLTMVNLLPSSSASADNMFAVVNGYYYYQGHIVTNNRKDLYHPTPNFSDYFSYNYAYMVNVSNNTAPVFDDNFYCGGEWSYMTSFVSGPNVVQVNLRLYISVDDSLTYANGYTDGYNEGVNDGYTSGFNDGDSTGYARGLQEGLASAQNGNFATLFNAVADTPIVFLRSLFNFDLFGMNVFIIIMSLLTGIVVIYVIKKVWK